MGNITPMLPIPPRSRASPAPARRLPNAPLLPKSRGRLRHHLPLRPQVSLQRRPHRRPDDPVRALRQKEHPRRQQSRRSPPRKPRSSSPTWPAPAWRNCSTTTATTSACAIMRFGTRTPRKRSYVRRLGRKTPADLRALPRVRRNPPAGSHRQHRHLPHPPDQLPARPATPPFGKGFREEGGLRERMTRVRLAHRNQPPKK